MAKPWKIYNGPDTPEGPGGRAAETGREGEETGTGGEGGEGKESATDDNPPFPHRVASRQRDSNLSRDREEVTVEEETAEETEEAEEDRGRDGETPREPRSRSLVWGGTPPPQRKMRTSQDST